MIGLKKLFLLKEGIEPPLASKIASGFVVAFLIFCLFFYTFSITNYDFSWGDIWEYREKFITGFINTIIISISALFLSIAFGLFFAYGSMSNILPLRYISRSYVEIIRGTPLLVQILIFFYIFADAFGYDNRFVAGIFIMAFFSGAYTSEIIRAGILSVPKEQHEAATSLNFSTFQKYLYIIMPQATKVMLPPLAGQFANLIKDSSLLSIISINEFTMNAQEVNAYTYSTLESYIPLAIGYLLLTYPLSYLSRVLEKRMSS
ncbi:MAG: amino acid ABC transporter permease [Campylobacterales bacterium]